LITVREKKRPKKVKFRGRREKFKKRRINNRKSRRTKSHSS